MRSLCGWCWRTYKLCFCYICWEDNQNDNHDDGLSLSQSKQTKVNNKNTPEVMFYQVLIQVDLTVTRSFIKTFFGHN